LALESDNEVPEKIIQADIFRNPHYQIQIFPVSSIIPLAEALTPPGTAFLKYPHKIFNGAVISFFYILRKKASR